MVDAISKQDALDIYDDYNIAVENGEIEAYGRFRKQLAQLPPIQPMTVQMYDVKEWHDFHKKMKIVGHSIVIAESAEEAKEKYLEHYGSSDCFIDNTHIEVYAVGQFYQLI